MTVSSSKSILGVMIPVLALAGTAANLVVVAPAVAGERPFAGSVVADYRISFSGINVGGFHFRSHVTDRTYTLESNAKLSLMFGTFKWRGATRSTGIAHGATPVPGNYVFDYRANSKTGSVRMAFAHGRVAQLDVLPKKKPSRKTVPLKREHLDSVFDPLSAVMALTQGSKTNPCRKRLAIFDGQQRFDLQLSYAGRERLPAARSLSQSNMGFVCRVRYIPVAGYKPNQVTRFMANNKGIRVVLRPVPNADVFVPHEVRVPTIAGDALLVAKRVVIKDGRRQQSALVPR